MQEFLNVIEALEETEIFYHDTTRDRSSEILAHDLDFKESRYADDEVEGRVLKTLR
jgi:hypothetical protein